MGLTPMRQILEEAEKNGYGVGAFNANYMEQIQGQFRAAKETDSPFIIQVSKTALTYTNERLLMAMLKEMAQDDEYGHLMFAVHLDHGTYYDSRPDPLELFEHVIDLGFTSVMIDGSLKEDGKTPRSFQENVNVTAPVVELAHPAGVTVEGELGTLGGIEDHIRADRVILTDPNDVEKFIAKTGVDALALAIGTSHGAYKFDKEPTLDMDRISACYEKAKGKAFLVMHGSSSVPKVLTDLINQYQIVGISGDPENPVITYRQHELYKNGGKTRIRFCEKTYGLNQISPEEAKKVLLAIATNRRLAPTMGVPTKMIQEAIRRGIRKINIDTDGRIATTAAILANMEAYPDNYDPRKYQGAGRDAIQKWVASAMKAFGSAGYAHDYEPKTLDYMKAFYASRGN